ncbi:MAG: ADP-ribosylglycohydrolase family protein, partial [Oscillospiraceae bacterium]|nr:ADP-ribosylglycohydrolase family protein [Oscillospiraceae bacterium]
MDKRDKFRGCLIGGAVGDALGYAVEFCSESKIFAKYGKNGISEYDITNGKAIVSDDTQMTMFTATALLDAVTRGRMRGIMGNWESYIALEYCGWYLTQTVPFPVDIEENYAKYSWVMNLPEMFQRRAPGCTCLSALVSGKAGSVNEPINDSAGCGGVMRVAPIGLYFANGNHTDMKPREIDLIGAEAAAITHGHELGYIHSAPFVQ